MENTDNKSQGEELSAKQKGILTKRENAEKKAELEQFVRDKIASYYEEKLNKPNMPNSINTVLPAVISVVENMKFRSVEVEENSNHIPKTEDFSNAKLVEIESKDWDKIIKKAIENKTRAVPVKGAGAIARQGRS